MSLKNQKHKRPSTSMSNKLCYYICTVTKAVPNSINFFEDEEEYGYGLPLEGRAGGSGTTLQGWCGRSGTGDDNRGSI